MFHRADPSPFRIAAAGRLRSLLLDGADPVLLLGAGASVKSGIPTAASTVERIARWAWCKDNGRHPDDFAIRRSDYWPWFTALPWYRQDVPVADLYPEAIHNLLGVKRDRREFFERLINPPGVPPSSGYRALTEILHQGWISTVLTTNFDECLERAQVLNNRPHRLVKINTPSDYVLFSSVPQDAQVIFLHGSVKHYTDKNLTSEVESLDPELINRLRPMLRDHPVIVVGYRGAEPSIMRDIFLNQTMDGGFLHGVYWCVLETERAGPFSPWLTKFATAIGTNFQLVPIKGFDHLFENDLLAAMLAAGALPTRRPSGHRAGDLPPDMRPLPNFPVTGLEASLLRSRLRQYAERMDLWRPPTIDADWLEQTVGRLDLVRPVGDGVAPTLAGWLLFAPNPSIKFPQARVEFEAIGPAHWLRGRFGEDTDLEHDNVVDRFIVRRTITGNLWNQLDTLIDLLAVVNFQFRLKAEVSRTVSAYNAIAIKEMIVNAIVHRDYQLDEPIRVTVEPKAITVTSPGGLIEQITMQVGNQSFQQAIAAQTAPIKGYRNPAISDLFYGGGQMDRRGSGLPDMIRLSVNNNGTLSFGPSPENSCFVVTLGARPEAVDEITNTALPLTEETVRYATNLIPFAEMPKTVWHVPTTAKSNRSFYRAAEGLAAPPGHVSDGRFYSLYQLDELSDVMVAPFDASDIETFAFEELLTIPGGEAIALKLLHDLLFDHLKAKGLLVEYDRRRAYYGKGAETEVKVSYHGRLRKATRTVVKARTKRESNDIIYYEHKAVSFAIMRFATDWALVLTPGYIFTRDGARKPISPNRTNALSTRRSARDFNATVFQDISFWLAVLSGETDGLFALEHCADNHLAGFAPVVLLRPQTPTISANIGPFYTSDHDTEIEKDLQDLEAEIEALALQPEVDSNDDEEEDGHNAVGKDDDGEGNPCDEGGDVD